MRRPTASSATRNPTSERGRIPAQIVGQPLAELEVALTGGPIAPLGGHFGDSATRERRLDRQFEGELEPRRALDVSRIEKAA